VPDIDVEFFGVLGSPAREVACGVGAEEAVWGRPRLGLGGHSAG